MSALAMQLEAGLGLFDFESHLLTSGVRNRCVLSVTAVLNSVEAGSLKIRLVWMCNISHRSNSHVFCSIYGQTHVLDSLPVFNFNPFPVAQLRADGARCA